MKCAVLPMRGVDGGTMRLMPFRFTRGPGVEQPWERDEREVDELLGLGCQKIPRLAEMRRRRGDPTSLAVLVRAGWSVKEIAGLVDTWPTISPVRLTGALGAAADAVEAGVTVPAQAIAWTHAMFAAKGKIAQARDIVDQMGAPGVRVEDGHGVSRAPFIEAYLASATTNDLALLAVAAGLTITETSELGEAGEDRRAELRGLAATRGVDVP
jgi:hypothetical protein